MTGYMHLIVLAASALVALTSANNVPVLLEQVESSINKIAETVCDNQSDKQQIGRISTIKSLADLIGQAQEGNLKKCADEYLTSINKLRDVVTVSNENVCSSDKLSLIEEFHRDYISTNPSDLVEREARGMPKEPKIPKLLAYFFMHYAVEVSVTCRKSLINNLDWDLKDYAKRDEDLAIGSEKSFFDRLLAGVFSKFTSLSSINNFDDVVLVWDLIDGSLLDHENPMIMEVETDSQTGEPIRLLVKMKQPEQINMMKEKCRTKLRPIYEKLILPIARLSNLGYSIEVPEFERELKELSTNDLVKRWYGVTQLCEAVMPIKFYKDDSMSPAEVTMIDPTEAAKLECPVVISEEAALVYEPTTNSLVHLDELTLVTSMKSQHLVKLVRTNLSARDRTVRRGLKKFANDLKNSIKSNIARIFLSKKEEKPEVAEASTMAEDRTDVSEMISKSLVDVSDADLEQMEGAAPRHREIKRHRRRERVANTRDPALAEKVSYMHTKSFREIIEGWKKAVEAVIPRRRKILKYGAFILFLLFVAAFVSLVVTFFLG